jgi:hypothetical protein
MNIYPIIEPEETRSDMLVFLTGDVVHFRHLCLVTRGLREEGGVHEPNDYHVVIRPVYSEDNIGTGCGCAAIVRANDTRLIHATGSTIEIAKAWINEQ